jgi:hypothetical protein
MISRHDALADDLVPDKLWAIVEPLLAPAHRTAAGTGPSPTGPACPIVYMVHRLRQGMTFFLDLLSATRRVT